MKTKINALVVDDSMEFTSSVKEYFKNNAVIKIVDVVTDGEKAVDYIKEHQDNIDVILMIISAEIKALIVWTKFILLHENWISMHFITFCFIYTENSIIC